MRNFFLFWLLLWPGINVWSAHSIVVDDVWVREAPPNARMLAAYMTLHNSGDEEQTLIGVSSPDFTHVMMHETRVVEGMARMLHRDRLEIPPQSSLAFEPGGLHLMMPAPDTRLLSGDRVEFVLEFADGARIPVQAEVKKALED